jgi:hypothetical protein
LWLTRIKRAPQYPDINKSSEPGGGGEGVRERERRRDIESEREKARENLEQSLNLAGGALQESGSERGGWGGGGLNTA